jgi:hypothetical protein
MVKVKELESGDFEVLDVEEKAVASMMKGDQDRRELALSQMPENAKDFDEAVMVYHL